MKVGRNVPCPCGSGKKYKHCCLGKDRANGHGASMQDFMAELRQAVSEQEFETLEDAQAFCRPLSPGTINNRWMRFTGYLPTKYAD